MRSIRLRALASLLALSVAAGCDQGQSIETEMRIVELQEYAMQLEGQLDFLYQEMTQLSRNLSTGVSNLEASLSDVHLRVLDLPSGELMITMREVEAAVAVANQRAAAVRATANDLARIVE